MASATTIRGRTSRVVRLKTTSRILDRLTQRIYPLEVYGDTTELKTVVNKIQTSNATKSKWQYKINSEYIDSYKNWKKGEATATRLLD
ncbi:hypothetical protein J6590_070117 [Homalodisca vitripennis]|nr:hypothetical protein J6590_070117 [Homalodisca vitripennis]